MDNRGVLTNDDRAFFRGDKETDDPDKTRREKRYNYRRRLEHLAEDLDLLREAGEEEMVEKFYRRFDRVARLEREVERLRRSVNEE